MAVLYCTVQVIFISQGFFRVGVEVDKVDSLQHHPYLGIVVVDQVSGLGRLCCVGGPVGQV